MAVSRYEDIAQKFLDDHPHGSAVSADRLDGWANQNANGHVIGTDLTIDDGRKRVSALRRHLNDGGRSHSISEDRRFFLAVEDPKRGSMLVRLFSDYATEQVIAAFTRSAGAAIAPIATALRQADDIKLEELPDEQRHRLEEERNTLEASIQPIRQAYRTETDRRMVLLLTKQGHSEQQARALLASMSTIGPYQKLLRKLS